MLSNDVEDILARATLWADSLGRSVAGVEHVAAVIMPVEGNADRWAVIEQLQNEAAPRRLPTSGSLVDALSGDLIELLELVSDVEPPAAQVAELERLVHAWVDDCVVLAAAARSPIADDVDDDADPSEAVDAAEPADGDVAAEEEDRLRVPSQLEAVERARQFESWLTGIIEGDDSARAALADLGTDVPAATSGMVAAAAAELLLADRSTWNVLADHGARRHRLVRQLASLTERRDVSYRRLVQMWDQLDAQQTKRFRVRLEVHLGEADLAADTNTLLARLDATVAAGPTVRGGWDCGRSDEQRVGVLLLLAERLVRDEDTAELAWACDEVRGRFGARVGPLARADDGSFVASPVRAGMTVFLGPPGSGKTTCLESAILTWPGPLIATTTKRNDWRPGFVSALLDKGPVWLLDATGEMEPPHPDVQRIRWSPLSGITDWDSARRAAHIVARSGPSSNLNDGDFWIHSAYQMISVYMFAAAQNRYPMSRVAEWIDAEEEAEVMVVLARLGNEAAALQFSAQMRMDEKTRNSVFVTARTATDPYRSDAVRAVTDVSEFDFTTQLIPSNGTVLVYADGFRAATTASLYALFVDAAITARKSLADSGWFGPHLMFALDEVANITPLPSLPQVLTEGPGRGITGIFCLQDLQQARARWGGDGDLFLTSSGHRVVFPGTTNREVHDFVLRHVRPTTTSPAFAGFHRDLDDRSHPTVPLTTSADVASPGETAVVVVDPLAQVSVGHQVRSFTSPEYVAAQHHAAVVYDERNRVVVHGLTPPQTDEVVVDLGDDSAFADEHADRVTSEDSIVSEFEPGRRSPRRQWRLGQPSSHREFSQRSWLDDDQWQLGYGDEDDAPSFDVVLDCRENPPISMGRLAAVIEDIDEDRSSEEARAAAEASAMGPTIISRSVPLDEARAALRRLNSIAPDMAYIVERNATQERW